MSQTSNFLFTGVTSGIGLCLIDEVAAHLKLSEIYDVNFCITCRSMKKGLALKSDLCKLYPSLKVTLVDLNVESVKSVLEACDEIKKRFDHLDCVYLNAGIMPNNGVEWKHVLKALIDLNLVEALKTGKGLFKTNHFVNAEGVNNVFATNVLGHFAMIQQLIPLLSRAKSKNESNFSKIIWTGSTAADYSAFNLNDITGNLGTNAYASSKYVVEAVSYELDRLHQDERIHSFVCDPGTVITNLTGSLIPFWVWYILMPFIWLARSVIPNFTMTSHNGCNSLLHVLRHHPRDLDASTRYNSRTDVINRNYVSTQAIHTTNASRIYQQIELLYQDIKCKT